MILPGNLRHLDLSHNSIKSWNDLNPVSFLQTAYNLETLILAGNPLGTFDGNDDRLLLASDSLKLLDLSDCQIHNINDPTMLNGLVNLDHLTLKLNPLYTLPDNLISGKLTSLDVSDCRLIALQQNVFTQMPQLSFVNFSGNHHISLVNFQGEFAASKSLQMIDLSRCNATSVELNGFPNLKTAILKENTITELTDKSFQNNDLIEKIDLSTNHIGRISIGAFHWLNRLRLLDLSSNMIKTIDDGTFAQNFGLHYIDLSRNPINRFRKLSAPNLSFLNLSRCEIAQIDEDALSNSYTLIELDLSNNFITKLPTLNGPTSNLQILDVSRCR